MKNAEELREVANKSLKELVFLEIEKEAEKGLFFAYIDAQKVSKEIVIKLRENGFSVTYIEGELELDEEPTYYITWDEKK